MLIVHRRRIEPILPQMAAAFVRAVHVLRVQPVRPTHRAGQARSVAGHQQQVHMIGHQAVGINFYTQCLLEFSQVREVALEVRWLCENDLPVVAALHDVMRVVR